MRFYFLTQQPPAASYVFLLLCLGLLYKFCWLWSKITFAFHFWGKKHYTTVGAVSFCQSVFSLSLKPMHLSIKAGNMEYGVGFAAHVLSAFKFRIRLSLKHKWMDLRSDHFNQELIFYSIFADCFQSLHTSNRRGSAAVTRQSSRKSEKRERWSYKEMACFRLRMKWGAAWRASIR